MTYYIGSARHDENGKYSGGRKGDQTGQEVATQKMYNHSKGWLCYRARDSGIAEKLREAMLAACSNPNIGYSQSDRYGVVKSGVKTDTAVNADCSSLVRACIIYATGKDPGDFNTGTEGQTLIKTGIFYAAGVVTKSSVLFNGDILVTASKGHTAIVTTGCPRTAAESATVKNSSNVLKGIKYANTFTGHTIAVSVNDMSFSELKLQRTRVLQHALNLDYGAGLTEDGLFGTKSKAALGTHYVKYGETQYMVTAAEILYYLIGTDAGGVEIPGVFGKGLKAAAGKSKITAQDFINLL